MKTTIFLLLLCFSNFAFSQQKVYQIDDFYEKVMPIKDVYKTYPTLNIIKLESSFNNVQRFENEQRMMFHDFGKFAKQKNIKFHEFKKQNFIPFNIMVNPSGEIDYAVYGFGKQSTLAINGKMTMYEIDEDTKNIIIPLAEDFFKTYKLPKDLADTKFSMNFSVFLGKETRKESKFYISTLELAEKCDKPDTVKELRLHKLYLEKFPEVVFRFKNLEELDLADNSLTEIPDKIWGLKKLRFLSLSGNLLNYDKLNFERNKHLKDLNLQYTNMNKIPKTLRKNRKLEVLFIGNNKIIEIEKSDFRGLKRLKAINLYNTRITTLPKTVKKLKRLEELDLYHNELKFLPKEICSLRNLRTLAISNNDLWKLPEEMAKLKNLKTLYAHHNKLNDLPVLPNLNLLDIGYNLFKVVPNTVFDVNNLNEFDCSKNQISQVPVGLLKLNSLKKIYIKGNDYNKLDEMEDDFDLLVEELQKKKVEVR